MQLVDQPRLQVLLDGCGTAGQAHVRTVGRIHCLLQRGLDAVGHEVEGGPARHMHRRSRMVGEDEDRVMIGRIISPPAGPLLVRPPSAYRPEHVAAHDRCPDPGEASGDEVVVETVLATLLPLHLQARSGLEHPGMEVLAADAEGILQALIRSGPVAVQRDGEIGHA